MPWYYVGIFDLKSDGQMICPCALDVINFYEIGLSLGKREPRSTKRAIKHVVVGSVRSNIGTLVDYLCLSGIVAHITELDLAGIIAGDKELVVGSGGRYEVAGEHVCVRAILKVVLSLEIRCNDLFLRNQGRQEVKTKRLSCVVDLSPKSLLSQVERVV